MVPHHCLRRPEPEKQEATLLKDNGRHPTHGQRPFVQLGSGSRNAKNGPLELTPRYPSCSNWFKTISTSENGASSSFRKGWGDAWRWRQSNDLG